METTSYDFSGVDMKYSLTDITTEPSDEQLAQLMKEVAAEAKAKSEAAHAKFFRELEEYVREQKKKFKASKNRPGYA